ncbi:unnamed protein product [Phaeothamnion confervicola]
MDAAGECDALRWSDVNWLLVLESSLEAPFYFIRSGLIRSDLLSRYSGPHMPPTFLVRTFAALRRILLRPRMEGILWTLKPASKRRAGSFTFDTHELLIRPNFPRQPHPMSSMANSNGGNGGVERPGNTSSDVFATMRDGLPMILQAQLQVLPFYPERALSAGADFPAAAAAAVESLERSKTSPCSSFRVRALVLAAGRLKVYCYKDFRVLISAGAAMPSLQSPGEGPVGLSTSSLPSLSPGEAPRQWEGAQGSFKSCTAAGTESHTPRSGAPAALPEDFTCNLDLRQCRQLGCGWGRISIDGAAARASIIDQIHEITTHVFVSLLAAATSQHFFATATCYELFALDFAVDREAKVWLLEAHANPAVTDFGRRYGELFRGSPLRTPPTPDEWRLLLESQAGGAAAARRGPSG